MSITMKLHNMLQIYADNQEVVEVEGAECEVGEVEDDETEVDRGH